MLFSRFRTPTLPEPADRRRNVRHTTVMQLAKIRLGSGQEELCLLRDVSPEGVNAEVYCAVQPDEMVEIELRTGHVIGGRVAWRRGTYVGVSFDELIPMSAMLAHCSFDDRMGRLRPPRLAVTLQGILSVGGATQKVRIGNISQAGLQIGADQPLHPGAPCTITLPALGARAATVRWWRDREAGLMLDDPLDYAAFASWRTDLAA